MEHYQTALDAAFHALADPTRRAVIGRLTQGPAPVKELAEPFAMGLPSFMKHLRVLEKDGLISSEKVGRVRTCRVNTARLAAAESWLTEQRELWQGRTDRLADYVETRCPGALKMPTNDTELTIDRFIKAPPARVWKAWSTPEHLAKWWIPAPMECKVVKLDLRPGGGFETLMREPGGDFQPHLDACFLEIAPEARLVFTTVLKEGWQPVEPWLAMTAIITFEAEAGGTRYAARALHKTAADSRKHDEMGFQEGWGTALGQLARLVEGLA